MATKGAEYLAIWTTTKKLVWSAFLNIGMKNVWNVFSPGAIWCQLNQEEIETHEGRRKLLFLTSLGSCISSFLIFENNHCPLCPALKENRTHNQN